jgi:hypothetical protein
LGEYEPGENVLSQMPGVSVFQVGTPALDGLGEFLDADALPEEVFFQAFEAATGLLEIGSANAGVGGQHSKADKAGTNLSFKELAFDGVNLETQVYEIIFDLRTGIGQEGAIVGE